MKLIAKVMDCLAVPGGAAVVLCDETGTMLPCQVSTVLESGVDGINRLTVTFDITGDELRLVP